MKNKYDSVEYCWVESFIEDDDGEWYWVMDFACERDSMIETICPSECAIEIEHYQ